MVDGEDAPHELAELAEADPDDDESEEAEDIEPAEDGEPEVTEDAADGPTWQDLGDGLPLDFDPSTGEVGPLEPLPPLAPGAYLILQPGGEVEYIDGLPRSRRFPLGLAVGVGELVFCEGSWRGRWRTPLGLCAELADAPLVERVVFAVVRPLQVDGPPRKSGYGRFADGVTGRKAAGRHRYLVALDSSGEVLGAIDNKPPDWELDPRLIQQLVGSVGVEYEFERHFSGAELENAHPDWIA